jgi:2-oxoglutarate dehydrogenase E2 component (dihydrolipoamide succinyltransferase)
MSQITDITLPADQLEGTEAAFSAWLVKTGDRVTKGQPIAELETDKVAMEVCAPVDGIIHSLTAAVGENVEPEQSLGTISDSAEESSEDAQDVDQSSTKAAPVPVENESKQSTDDTSTADNKNLISPAVRRLIHQQNLSLDNITGSGKRGRVTRDDVLRFIKSGAKSTPAQFEKTVSPQASSPYSSELPTARPLAGEMHPHSNMRKSIANHMVSSLLETSPHVTSVFEMDMGNIIEHRKWHKKEFEKLGIKLTFTAYFLSAMAKAVAKVPQVNARFHEDALELFSDVNIGVGTALGDDGLVVPVVQQVQVMNLFQVAQSLNLQTEKARTGKLTPADMKNGTLTISNHGVSGSLFATPIIINQPQVAILGVGKLEKRVVVEQVNGADQMVIRPKCYVSLSIDHRALDAHQTNLFLAEFVHIIESWGE